MSIFPKAFEVFQDIQKTLIEKGFCILEMNYDDNEAPQKGVTLKFRIEKKREPRNN